MRRALPALLLLFATACFMLPVPAAGQVPAATEQPIHATATTAHTFTPTPFHTCVVNTAVLNLRACAGTHCTTRAWLKKGDRLTILSQQQPWLNIETQNRDTGWVHSKFCTGE